MAGETPKPAVGAMADNESDLNFVVSGAKVRCTFQSTPCEVVNNDSVSYETGLGKQICDMHTTPLYFKVNFGVCKAPGRPEGQICDLKLYERWFGASETAFTESTLLDIKHYNEIMNGKAGDNPAGINDRFTALQGVVEKNLGEKAGLFGLTFTKDQKKTAKLLKQDNLKGSKINQGEGFQDEKNDVETISKTIDAYIKGGIVDPKDATLGPIIEQLQFDLNTANHFLNQAEKKFAESSEAEKQHRKDKKSDAACMHPLKKESELPCWMGGLITLIDNGQTAARANSEALRTQLVGEFTAADKTRRGEIMRQLDLIDPPSPIVSKSRMEVLGSFNQVIRGAQSSGWENVDIKRLNATLTAYNIVEPQSVRHFMTQCSIETGFGQVNCEYKDMRVIEKYGYANKNGNRGIDDAVKYRGGGYIQLTGRNSYQGFSDHLTKLGQSDPRIMESGSEYVGENCAWEASAYFWAELSSANKIASDPNTTILQMCNLTYNGDAHSSDPNPNGYVDKKKLYEEIEEVF